MDRLAPRHRVVAYDARGYGETEYEREDGWSAVADAPAVLDAAGLARAVVVACSKGGQTAVDLALAHPDLGRLDVAHPVERPLSSGRRSSSRS